MQWITWCVCVRDTRSGYIPRCVTVVMVLLAWRQMHLALDITKFPSRGVVLFCLPTSHVGEGLFAFSLTTDCIVKLLIFAYLMSEKLYINIILICISLLSEIEHFILF